MQYVGKTMRYANRIDENQNEIVKALRKAGAYVRIISQGDGIPASDEGSVGSNLLQLDVHRVVRVQRDVLVVGHLRVMKRE